MTGSSREGRWTLLVTVVLLTAVCALVWTGLRTGHLGLAADPVPVETQAAHTPASPTRSARTPTPSPTAGPTLALVPPDPALVAQFEAQSVELGGEYALAWVDDDGLHLLGAPVNETAWSTIKVPLAIAAAEQAANASGKDPWPQIEAAVTRSDNDAALQLWVGLGAPEEAAAAVDEVLSAYNSTGTRTESQIVRPGFSAIGQTLWSLADQARFASALMCEPPEGAAGQVRGAMGRVVRDQRWAMGQLEEPHVKSGWGPDEGGAYVLRQLGDGVVDGQRYALAVSGRATPGTYPEAAADLNALVDWWVQAAPKGAGLACPP